MRHLKRINFLCTNTLIFKQLRTNSKFYSLVTSKTIRSNFLNFPGLWSSFRTFTAWKMLVSPQRTFQDEFQPCNHLHLNHNSKYASISDKCGRHHCVVCRCFAYSHVRLKVDAVLRAFHHQAVKDNEAFHDARQRRWLQLHSHVEMLQCSC